jgi:hypothetical protein
MGNRCVSGGAPIVVQVDSTDVQSNSTDNGDGTSPQLTHQCTHSPLLRALFSLSACALRFVVQARTSSNGSRSARACTAAHTVHELPLHPVPSLCSLTHVPCVLAQAQTAQCPLLTDARALCMVQACTARRSRSPACTCSARPRPSRCSLARRTCRSAPSLVRGSRRPSPDRRPSCRSRARTASPTSSRARRCKGSSSCLASRC